MEIKNFGELFESVLLEKGITAYKLSKLTGISQQYIHQIKNNKNEPSVFILNKISIALSVDLRKYYDICSDFNSLNEYKEFLKLRGFIENINNNMEVMENTINNIEIEKVKQGLFLQTVYYAKATIYAKKYKMYNESLKSCFNSMCIKPVLFNINNVEKYMTSEFTYSVLHLISYNYFHNGQKEKSLQLNLKLIEIIQSNYFNEKVIKLDLPKIIFRTYVATLNNLADTFFNMQKYDVAINYCEKGINTLLKENSFYSLSYLYEILAQVLYSKGNFDESKIYFEKAIGVCKLNSEKSHLLRIEERIANEYNKINY